MCSILQNSSFTEEQLIFHLFLSRITFLSCEEKNFLYKKLDSVNRLAISSINDIENLVCRSFSKKVVWQPQENLRMARLALHYCRQLNITILLNTEEDFPPLLREIADPPYLLFCRGDVSLLQKKSISIVGTRRVTAQGSLAAKDFAYAAVKDGVNIVSGLAAGVDGAAHLGAVNALFDCREKEEDESLLGRTIAVLPSSIDSIIPAGNKMLAEKIIKSGGLLISEYEPKMEMAKWHFVARNRIIAGLSFATLVIQAPVGSGALITADFALDYGRDLLFHKACLEDSAKMISQKVKGELQTSFAKGCVSKYKIENCIEKFISAGAPVINDYADFCIAINEMPGKRAGLLQSELF